MSNFLFCCGLIFIIFSLLLALICDVFFQSNEDKKRNKMLRTIAFGIFVATPIILIIASFLNFVVGV